MPLRDKLRKLGTIAGAAAERPHSIKEWLIRIYNDIKIAEGPVPTAQPSDFVDEKAAVTLQDWISIDGNVRVDELVFLCALARTVQPTRVVEIGTFDGNTTLQLARNTPPECRIHTLDLGLGDDVPPQSELSDARYISSERRARRRFQGTDVEHKITQCYGNSLTYDFSTFTAQGKPQFIFIDGGHSYECVRSDTEKALSILEPGGVIAWHDYTVFWPSVYRYLGELSRTLNLAHIAGTHLVVHRSMKA